LKRWSAARTVSAWNSPGRVQADGGDFCGPNSGAGRGCANQCAAQGGSSGARKAATGVKWFETQAEGGAHRVAPMAAGGSIGCSHEERRQQLLKAAETR
jgi:hypothetical protein